MMIQVHIADDHRMLVEGLQAAIEESGTAKVVDISHTLAVCRTTLRFRHPDVLLLDISMPDGSGIDFCKEMHEAYPDMKILMLTSYDEYTMVNRAIAAGASGYIQKNALSEEGGQRHRGRHGGRHLFQPRHRPHDEKAHQPCRVAHCPRAGTAAPHRGRLHQSGNSRPYVPQRGNHQDIPQEPHPEVRHQECGGVGANRHP